MVGKIRADEVRWRDENRAFARKKLEFTNIRQREVENVGKGLYSAVD